ncbi:MAG: Ku protein [Candidatus Binatia bacterium]
METKKKAYWQGTLTCDVMTIPVKLYSVLAAHEPRFHYLHAPCRTPIEARRHCPQCNVTVTKEAVVRGYEYEDELVIVNEQELAALPHGAPHVITVQQCVQAQVVDPIYFDHAFYLEPGQGGKKAYALLLETLRQGGMVALGTAILREQERYIVLRPARSVLVLHTLLAEEDLIPIEQLDLPQRLPHPAEVTAALGWVTRLGETYTPEQWIHHTPTALEALIARKARNKTSRVPARFPRKSPPSSPQAAA